MDHVETTPEVEINDGAKAHASRPRRLFAATAVAAGLVAVVAAGFVAFNQPGATIPHAEAQEAKTIPMADLLQTGALDDKVLGNENAPVTIVEYASMTCGHCGSFHNTVFPQLKEKYIDTGKVRFIFREFPLGSYAAAASMLARCVDEDKYFPFLSLLFKTQDQWAYVSASQRVQTLLDISKQAGFTRERFQTCLSDQKLLDGINQIRDRASDVFGVSSTPSFFVDGELVRGAATLADLEKLIEPKLEGES